MVVLKKGMKMTFIFILTFWYATSALAQINISSAISQHSISQSSTALPIRALKVGDVVPDIVFENVLNYPSSKANLSDFKGKLVILDMWSVSCGTCIAYFPKLDKLQEEFKDKIQILLVNPHSPKYDSKEKILSLLGKLKKRTGFYPSLPIPIHDSILNAYFPHQSVPHYVWISEEGKVIAITGMREVTEANVRDVMEGKKINMPVKNDWTFYRDKPIFVDGNGGGNEVFFYRSMFTKYIGGIGSTNGTRINEDNLVTGIFILNKPLVQFVKHAYLDIINRFSNNRIIIDVYLPKLFKQEFDSTNIFCYDLTIPPTSLGSFDARKCLREDLKRVFNISVYIEKRKAKCFVVRATEKIISSNTRYIQKAGDLRGKSIKKFLHNYQVYEAIEVLQEFFPIPLILPDDNADQRIDIDFPDNFNLSDSEAIIKELEKAGFDIKEEEREIEVVIITDK